MTWQGFVKESKSYMNHPDCWKEWKAQLYLSNGKPDLNYIGWTKNDKRKAKLEFWLKFPRAWFIFHRMVYIDWLNKIWQHLKSNMPLNY